MVASHEAFVILVDFLDLNRTEKLIFFFCLGMKICPEENYPGRRWFGEMKLDKIPLGKCSLVFVTIHSVKSLPQVVQMIFVAVCVNFGSN